MYYKIEALFGEVVESVNTLTLTDAEVEEQDFLLAGAEVQVYKMYGVMPCAF